jgi:quinolinate synthase
LEVPGEMFEIALQKSFQDEGVVGSTSDILRFISNKVSQSLCGKDTNTSRNGAGKRLQFILGTEAGMVTSIVRSVSDILNNATSDNIEVEIIFPVSSEAVTSVNDHDNQLAVVPGVPSGDGCSTAGGCATCPFMKMNNLDSLNDVVDMIISNNQMGKLKSHRPPNRLNGKSIDGVDAVELGYESILFMRHFMKEKKLPDDLLRLITRQRSSML